MTLFATATQSARNAQALGAHKLMSLPHRLKDFDLLVCDQIHRVISCHFEDPRFADAMKGLDADLLAALSSEPPLGDRARETPSFERDELYAIQLRIAALPMRLTKHWIWSPSIGRQAVRCVPEINTHFSPVQGRRWDAASADFDGRLQRRHLHLDEGIKIVHEWLGLAREYLAALGQFNAEFAPLSESCRPSTKQPATITLNTSPSPIGTTASADDSDTANTDTRSQPVGSSSAFLSPPQVAERLRLSPTKVLTWIKSGELVAVNAATKSNGRPRYRISPSALAAFEKRRNAMGKPMPTKPRRRTTGGVIEFFKAEATSPCVVPSSASAPV